MVFCLYLSIADWQIDLWIQWVSMDCESQNLCNGFSTNGPCHSTFCTRECCTRVTPYPLEHLCSSVHPYPYNLCAEHTCQRFLGFLRRVKFWIGCKTMECEKLYPTYILLPQNRVHGVSDGWFHICDVNYQTHFLKLIFLRSHRTIYRLFLIVYHFHRMWFCMVCDV